MSIVPQADGATAPTGRYRETNGLAIASLVLGMIAIVPVAIVLGIIALVQIERRGDNGKGLAIAGISLSCAWVVVAAIAAVVLVSNFAKLDATGQVTKGGLISELRLLPGHCLNKPNEDAVLIKVVRCDEAHDAEVFARFTLAGDGWPGAPNIGRRAMAGCFHRVDGAYPDDLVRHEIEVSWFSPDRIDWAVDDHDVTCFANFLTQWRELQLQG